MLSELNVEWRQPETQESSRWAQDPYNLSQGGPKKIAVRSLVAAIAVALASAALLAALPVHAQSFPSKPLKIVTSAPPGGSPDVLARIVGQGLSTRLGVPVTIENTQGGAGNIAANAVARSNPDGHTLLTATAQLSVNETLFKDLPFHAVDSFAAVVNAVRSVQVLAVHKDSKFRSVREFVAAAKAAPEQLTIASPAIGTTGHLGVLMLQNQAGFKVTAVPYKGSNQALADVLGQRADAILVTIAPALPFIKDGRLRAIGVPSPTRSREMPNVPTFAEQGIANFDLDSWQGFVARSGTPKPLIDRLNREINAVLKDPAVRTALEKAAFEVEGGTPEAFARLISNEIGTWKDIILANNIRAE